MKMVLMMADVARLDAICMDLKYLGAPGYTARPVSRAQGGQAADRVTRL